MGFASKTLIFSYYESLSKRKQLHPSPTNSRPRNWLVSCQLIGFAPSQKLVYKLSKYSPNRLTNYCKHSHKNVPSPRSLHKNSLTQLEYQFLTTKPSGSTKKCVWPNLTQSARAGKMTNNTIVASTETGAEKLTLFNNPGWKSCRHCYERSGSVSCMCRVRKHAADSV